MAAEAFPRRRASVELVEVLGNAILHCHDRERAATLGPFERSVWELCDGDHGAAEIALLLGEEEPGGPEGAEICALLADVQAVLAQFATVGFTEPVATSALSRHEPPWYASDNGYSSVGAMEDAHGPMVELALVALGRSGGNVLDLGCGNGALLEKIMARTPRAVPFGVDVDPVRIGHVETVLGGFAANFFAADMFGASPAWVPGRRYRLAILAPRRLLEADEAAAESLRQRLRAHCEWLLLYVPYGDGLSLAERARASGLRVTGPEIGSDAVAACLATVDGEHGTIAISPGDRLTNVSAGRKAFRRQEGA